MQLSSNSPSFQSSSHGPSLYRKNRKRKWHRTLASAQEKGVCLDFRSDFPYYRPRPLYLFVVRVSFFLLRVYGGDSCVMLSPRSPLSMFRRTYGDSCMILPLLLFNIAVVCLSAYSCGFLAPLRPASSIVPEQF